MWNTIMDMVDDSVIKTNKEIQVIRSYKDDTITKAKSGVLIERFSAEGITAERFDKMLQGIA